MDLPNAPMTVADNPFMSLPNATPERSLAKYYAVGVGETPGIEKLPGWVQKLHSAIDPMKALGGLPGVVSMALPAGKGPIKTPTAEELHTAGNMQSDIARNANVAIDPQKVASWAKNVQMGLRRRGMQPTSSSAPNVHSILDDLQKPGPENPYLQNNVDFSVADYIDLRRALQKEAQKFSPGAKYDQAAASAAIKRLDNLFDTTTQFTRGAPRDVAAVRGLVKESRANQAAGFRSDTLTNKQAGAELQTRATNSGMNLDNKIRQKTAALINPDNVRGTSLAQRQGYSPEEIAGMNRIVGGVPGANTARLVGNLMGGGGGLGAVVSGGVGGAGAMLASGNPKAALIGAAVPATGMAIKGIENALTNRAMTKLASSVRMRSPLGTATQPGPYSLNALALKLLLAAPDAWEQLSPQAP